MGECVWGRIMTSWTLLEVNWTQENFSIFDPKVEFWTLFFTGEKAGLG